MRWQGKPQQTAVKLAVKLISALACALAVILSFQNCGKVSYVHPTQAPDEPGTPDPTGDPSISPTPSPEEEPQPEPTATPVPLPPQGNVVLNPSFESALASWTPTGDATIVTGNAHGGTYSLRLGPTASGAVQDVLPQLVRGYAYRFMASAKVGAAGETARFTITLKNGGVVIMNHVLTVKDTYFRRYVVDFVIPVNVTQALITIDKDATANAAFADAVTLTYRPLVHTVPGIVQSEDYNLGGQGVGYNDQEAANLSTEPFREGPDVMQTLDLGVLGYKIGYFRASEWLKYDIDAPQAGLYTLEIRYAKDANVSPTASTVEIEIDGKLVSPAVALPGTGGYEKFVSIDVPNVQLTAGPHVLRVINPAGGFDLNYLKFK